MGAAIHPFLQDLCTTDARLRRQRLEQALRASFPGRLRVQHRSWAAGAAARDTVNFLVTFGKDQGHLALGAHYDAYPGAPGANDNGAAVVQLFLAAQALAERVATGEPEPDVTFCFWDHEELFGSDVMGSKLYLEECGLTLPRKAIVFDVSGIGEFYVSGWDGSGLCAELPLRPTPPSDDRILSAAGIPTSLVCALPPGEMDASLVRWPSTWRTLHTEHDTPDRVPTRTLEAGAALALTLVDRFRAA